RFVFPLGEAGSDVALAPLLCAGLIGWRSLLIAGEGKKLGLYGFGAAAHILLQVAKWQGRSVFAFTRRGDIATQDFATALGATWAGGSDEMPPEIDPLFQAERNNPVTVANLVAENSYQASAIDAIMREGRVKLSKAVGISEQG